MVDIAKCNGVNCPIKDKCYRYTVEAGDYQSYGSFEYKDGKCEYFWDNKDYLK